MRETFDLVNGDDINVYLHIFTQPKEKYLRY